MEVFKCNECGKEFKSGKSLGGHISSHNRGESYKLKRQSLNSLSRRNKAKEKVKKCKFCGDEFIGENNGLKLGGHIVMCKRNPKSKATRKKISDKKVGKTHSQEFKDKISEGMKKAHSEGRAWNIGMSRWNNKKSYPEEFFTKVIETHFDDKKYINEFPFMIYSFDFAWPSKMKAIEIDGSQHQRFKEIIERDKKKDTLARENGWKVLRIKWIDMYNNPKDYIDQAYKFIHT